MYIKNTAEMAFVHNIRTSNVDEIDTCMYLAATAGPGFISTKLLNKSTKQSPTSRGESTTLRVERRGNIYAAVVSLQSRGLGTQIPRSFKKN